MAMAVTSDLRPSPTKEGSSLSACLYFRCHGSHHRVDLGNPVADFFPLRRARVGVLPRIAKRDGIRRKIAREAPGSGEGCRSTAIRRSACRCRGFSPARSRGGSGQP
jgi:hypothetical protein